MDSMAFSRAEGCKQNQNFFQWIRGLSKRAKSVVEKVLKKKDFKKKIYFCMVHENPHIFKNKPMLHDGTKDL